MWELVYEDTFGFGEDSDPPKVECCGESDIEGFFHLWDSVLSESITGTAEKPVLGFSQFTLVLTRPDGDRNYISLDIDRYINKLAFVREKRNREIIKYISASHHDLYIRGEEEKFWSSLPG